MAHPPVSGPLPEEPAQPALPELLAPAGDMDALLAALGAGADAVYFGLDEGLNARARAQNFPVAELPALCDRIHRAGARANLTLNTLVFEEELEFLEGLVRAAARAGVDALIVQDPAVALLARAVAPTMEVHASTQMTVSSPVAARFAAEIGCCRVVLPRELSTAEIRRFVTETRGLVGSEVFIHGALCMSWSGQCLTSEAWGGRSANRGQCAQSCRLPYRLVVDGAVRDTADVSYLLSPLDQAAFQAIPALVEMGVQSLKIEGRLKGAAYVQTAVEGYRRQLQAAADGTHADPAAQAALRADRARMGLTYSRGFSPGFFGGVDHQHLVEGRFPKHRGLLLGTVTAVEAGEHGASGGAWRVRVSPPTGALPGEGRESARDLLAGGPASRLVGMGAGFDTGRPEEEEPGGAIATAEVAPGGGWWLGFGGRPVKPGTQTKPGARPGARPAARPGARPGARSGPPAPVRIGDRVWLSGDPRLEAEAERLIAAGEPEGRLRVRLSVRGREGEPLEAVFSWSEAAIDLPLAPLPHGRPARSIAVRGLTALPLSRAESRDSSGAGGLDEATVRAKLGALGGTPFSLAGVDISGLPPGLHIPVSELKQLRRALLPELLDRLLASFRHPGASPGVSGAAAAAIRADRAQAFSRSGAAGAAGAGVPDPGGAPQLIPLCRTMPQLEAVIAAGLPEVELDWMELVGLRQAVERARGAGLRVGIATVRVHKPGEEAYDRRVAAMQPDSVLVRHWAGLVQFSQPAAADSASAEPARAPIVHGDFPLNVTNSVTAHHLFSLGLATLTAAHDLDEAQLRALLRRVPAHRIAVVLHHHISTFHTEHCVYAHMLSKGRDWRTCGRPCEQHRVALQDPSGLQHPVVVDVGCRNTVFEARAQSAAKVAPGLIAAGVRRFRVEFVWEDAAQAARVLDACAGLLAGRISPAEVISRVAAQERFGVTAGTMRTMTDRSPA